MSVSSEIKKANGLVSHSHKLIQLSSKTSQKSKKLKVEGKKGSKPAKIGQLFALKKIKIAFSQNFAWF